MPDSCSGLSACLAELPCVMRNSPAVLRLGFVVVAVLPCVMRNGDGWAGHGPVSYTHLTLPTKA